MKILIGIISTVIVLTGAVLTILALWGIQPVSWEIVWKSGVTITIVSGTVLLIYLLYYIFFKGNFSHKKGNNRSYPLN